MNTAARSRPCQTAGSGDARAGRPLAIQLGILGLTFTLTCAVFHLSMGSLARKVLYARPTAAQVITRFHLDVNCVIRRGGG